MATYNKFESGIDYIFIGECDFDASGDTISVYLTNLTPSASADSIKTDLAEITPANGYTGPEDTAQTWAEASGTGTLTGTKVVITASGGAINQFQYVVLFDDTHASDILLAWWDYGSALDLADGESFTIKFNNGDPTGTIFTAA